MYEGEKKKSILLVTIMQKDFFPVLVIKREPLKCIEKVNFSESTATKTKWLLLQSQCILIAQILIDSPEFSLMSVI